MFYVITLDHARAPIKLNVIRPNMRLAAPTARKTPRAYHHGDLREALIAAAMAEVQANGADGVNFSALARTVGVSQAAPYRHFADRDELLAAVAAEAFRSFSASLAAEMQKASRRSPVGQLAHAYLGLGVKQIGLYRLMYGLHLVQRSSIGSELQVAVEMGFREILAIMGEGTDAQLRERIALGLWTSLHGVVMLVDQGLFPLKTRKVTTENLVDDFVAAAERAIAAAKPR
ncbi:hypothetical protein sos41_18340 [Alphaproteobacteria bacterium SO-S41]|nr:hypothetical protein sos41_18340 [Alphaproteobacteria bacterium SO-S41]